MHIDICNTYIWYKIYKYIILGEGSVHSGNIPGEVVSFEFTALKKSSSLNFSLNKFSIIPCMHIANYYIYIIYIIYILCILDKILLYIMYIISHYILYL